MKTLIIISVLLAVELAFAQSDSKHCLMKYDGILKSKALTVNVVGDKCDEIATAFANDRQQFIFNYQDSPPFIKVREIKCEGATYVIGRIILRSENGHTEYLRIIKAEDIVGMDQ